MSPANHEGLCQRVQTKLNVCFLKEYSLSIYYTSSGVDTLLYAFPYKLSLKSIAFPPSPENNNNNQTDKTFKAFKHSAVFGHRVMVCSLKQHRIFNFLRKQPNTSTMRQNGSDRISNYDCYKKQKNKKKMRRENGLKVVQPRSFNV